MIYVQVYMQYEYSKYILSTCAICTHAIHLQQIYISTYTVHLHLQQNALTMDISVHILVHVQYMRKYDTYWKRKLQSRNIIIWFIFSFNSKNFSPVLNESFKIYETLIINIIEYYNKHRYIVTGYYLRTRYSRW